MGIKGLSRHVMQLGHETDHLIPSKAKDMNGWSYGSIAQNALMMCNRTLLTHTVVVMVKILVMYKAVFLFAYIIICVHNRFQYNSRSTEYMGNKAP
jgi:hypothetical protein